MEKNNTLIWMDLEFTSLDFHTNTILEIATIATDTNLNILEEGPDIIVHQKDQVLDRALTDSWIKEHLGELIETSRTQGTSLEDAEEQTLAFIKKYAGEKEAPLCGNSVCADRRVLYRVMPAIEEYLHYRSIDVSTIKELAKRWRPDLPLYTKKEAHRARADIIESIEELKYYREKIFK